MNDDARKALSGQLGSDDRWTIVQVKVQNTLGIDVRLFWATPDGLLAGYEGPGAVAPGYPGMLVKAGQVVPLPAATGPAAFVVTEAHSGGFICVLRVETPYLPDPDGLTITRDMMVAPGDVGPIPEPSMLGRLIPVDSPRVVVGYGQYGAAHIVREQCWRRLPDSYTLAAGETRTMSRTVTSGMERTSSETTAMEASLGLSASGGVGPMSVAVSTSLNASSSHTQSLTFETHETSFVSETLTNGPDRSVMYLRWQLTDIVTVHGGGVPMASMVTVGEPCVLRGPYALNYAGQLTSMEPLEPVVIVGGADPT